MTYNEIMENEAIEFVMLRPSNSADSLSILKKQGLKETHLDGYTFRGMYNNKTDMVEFIKNA